MTLDELKALNNKGRKPMSHTESQTQIACVRWFRLIHPTIVIFAIPNAAKRGIALATIMKREGMLAGVADLMILKATANFHGLFIEMKTEDGKQTETQHQFEWECIQAGYKYVVCRSFDEFRQVVTEYLS